MKLDAPFYHGLDGKILKICVAWPWEIFFIWINYETDSLHGRFQLSK